MDCHGQPAGRPTELSCRQLSRYGDEIMPEPSRPGISLLEQATTEGREVFRMPCGRQWPAARPASRPRRHRVSHPCGTVVDRNSRPADVLSRDAITPRSRRRLASRSSEALLVPFHFHGDAVGTDLGAEHTTRGGVSTMKTGGMLGQLVARRRQRLSASSMQERLATDLASTERLQELSARIAGRESGRARSMQKIVDAAALIMRSDFASPSRCFSPEPRRRRRIEASRSIAASHQEAAHHLGMGQAQPRATTCGASAARCMRG